MKVGQEQMNHRIPGTCFLNELEASGAGKGIPAMIPIGKVDASATRFLCSWHGNEEGGLVRRNGNAADD